MRLAKVKSLASSSDIIIPITSEDKPDLLEEVIKKWQQILDLAAKIIGVPSGLITRLSEEKLEVFLTSNTENNIFDADGKFDLGAGWYCESVAAQRKEMLIENAYKLENWKENPSLPFNMISYMGVPIFWPDGEVFGTFCMLDNKANPYSAQYQELLLTLREIIQNDLKSALLYQKAQKDLRIKDYQIREVHHRVKNHFSLLLNTLSLQSFIGSQQDPKAIISEIQSRIFAISSIHDKLYHSLDIENITLGEYLCGLGKYIIVNVAEDKIDYNCESDEVLGDAEISLPCGLLLNELTTNSIKYAFRGVDDPKININLKVNDREVTLVYKDNGCGIDCSFNIEDTESLGMILIKQLVLKLGGKYRIYNENGFTFETTFSIDKNLTNTEYQFI